MEVSSAEVTNAEVTTAEVTTAEVTTAEVTTAEVLVDHTPARILSPFTSLFLMISGALGAGILNFPYGFMRVGDIRICIIMEIVIAALMTFSFYMIAYATIKGNYHSYMDMINSTMGNKFGTLTIVIIALYTLGSCAVYTVIVGNQVTLGTTLFITNKDAWYADRRFWMCLVTLILFFPFLLPKTLKLLGNASVVGGFACIYIVISIVVKYTISTKQPDYIPAPLPPKVEILSVINLFTALIFGFQNHLGSVSILSQIRDPSLTKYLAILFSAILSIGIIYGMIGTCGMLAFGTSVNPDVLLNYDPKDIPIGVGRFMIVIILISSYSLTAYIGRLCFHGVIDQIIRAINKPSVRIDEQTTSVEQSVSDALNINRFAWYGSAVLWYLGCIIIGIFIPNIGQIIPYVGGLAGFITLVGPAFVFMSKITENYEFNKSFIPKCIACILAAGVGGFMIGAATTLPIVFKKLE